STTVQPAAGSALTNTSRPLIRSTVTEPATPTVNVVSIPVGPLCGNDDVVGVAPGSDVELVGTVDVVGGVGVSAEPVDRVPVVPTDELVGAAAGAGTVRSTVMGGGRIAADAPEAVGSLS